MARGTSYSGKKSYETSIHLCHFLALSPPPRDARFAVKQFCLGWFFSNDDKLPLKDDQITMLNSGDGWWMMVNAWALATIKGNFQL